MRSFFLIGADFPAVPVFDEPVLEEDMQNPMDMRRKVIRMPPMVAGVDEELALPDLEEGSDESRKNNDGNGPGTVDPG